MKRISFRVEPKSRPSYAVRFSLSGIVLLLIPALFLFQTDTTKGQAIDAPPSSVLSQNPLDPARNAIIYEHPRFASTGKSLTDAEVAQRFSHVIYARNQMEEHLSGYRKNGFRGEAMIYLIADEINGPPGLSSVSAQGKTCSQNGVKQNTDVFASNAAMDDGDFCQIHDAIVQRTCLVEDGYADICPTENWFLHRSDGSRYEEKDYSSFSGYRPNPEDSGWKKYFTWRARRELSNTEPETHPSVPNVDGLFIDNLELSWSKLLREGSGKAPQEYSSNCEYVAAVRSFVAFVYSELNSEGDNFPIWANMISDPEVDQCFGTGGTSWTPFEPYLEGGMNENYALYWGEGPADIAVLEHNMTKASSWIKKGKHFVAVAQGNFDNSYNMYAFAAYLMVADGERASYYYSDQSHTGAYRTYYNLPSSPYPDYNYPLGKPMGDRYLTSTRPRIWQRKFQCGQVSLDVTNHIGNIEVTPNCKRAYPTSSSNLIQNPGFESGTEGWRFYTDGGASFSTTASSALHGIQAGEVLIHQPGEVVNLFQKDLILSPRTKYRLSFAAKSNTRHNLKVTIDEQDGDFDNYGLDGFFADLSSSWKIFNVEFTTKNFNATVSDARLRFALHNYDAAGDIFTFDNVYLSKSCSLGPFDDPNHCRFWHNTILR